MYTRVLQAEQAEALSDEARALVEEQAGSLYGKTHNRSGVFWLLSVPD